MKLLLDSQRSPALLTRHVPCMAVDWRSVTLGLLVSMAMAGCSDSSRSTAERVTGGSPQPVPALTLLATVPSGTMYVGDSLPLRVQLTSPRDRREAYLATRAREEGKAASPSQHFVDSVPADWGDRLALTLVRVLPDGRRETVIASGALSQWRVTRLEAKGAPEVRIGDPVEQWRVPPEVAQLAPGRYALSAQWDGTDAVDASWFGSERVLRTPEVAFEVRVPGSDAERAEHAERRAQEEFEAGRYREAQERGRKALRLDPAGVLTHARAETYLLVARSSLALGDSAAAAETYRTLLGRLPPPEANDLAVAVEQWLAAVER